MTALLAAAIAVTPGWARAERGDGPCRTDVEALCPSVTPGPGSFHYCLGTLCPDMKPGPGGFLACLEQHSDKLSAACQEHLREVQAKMDAWKQACQSDVQTFCSDAGTGPRAIGKCLRQHEDQLSQTCKDQLAQHHKRGCYHHETPTPG
jgi:hypothetical protein